MLILRDAGPQHLDQANESVNEPAEVEVVADVAVDVEVLLVEEVVALLLLKIVL